MSRFFNGGDGVDKLIVSSAPVTAVPLSMSAHIRMNTLTLGASFPVLTIDDNATTNRFALGVCDGATINVLAVSVASSTIIEGVSTGSISDTTGFHHAGAVFASTTSRTAFLDGVAGTTDTNSSTPSGIAYTRIGCKASNLRDFNGYIAHPAIWSVALSADEMAALAKGASPLSIRPASLVFYSPYLGRDSPEIDIVGGRTLTVTGTSSSTEEPPQLRSPSRKGNRIFVPPKFGNVSLRFRGGDEYTDVAAAPVTATPLTLMIWIKNPGTLINEASSTQFIDLGYPADNTHYFFRIGMNGYSVATYPGLAMAQVRSPSGTQAAYSNEEVTADDQWHHVCGVFTSSTNRGVFLDGDKGPVAPEDHTPSGITTLRIGGRQSGYIQRRDRNPPNISLAHPAIWNVALTDEEVVALAAGASPLSIRSSALKFYAPHVGRDGTIIDVVGGLTLKNYGASSLADAPRLMPATSWSGYNYSTATGLVFAPNFLPFIQ